MEDSAQNNNHHNDYVQDNILQNQYEYQQSQGQVHQSLYKEEQQQDQQQQQQEPFYQHYKQEQEEDSNEEMQQKQQAYTHQQYQQEQLLSEYQGYQQENSEDDYLPPEEQQQHRSTWEKYQIKDSSIFEYNLQQSIAGDGQVNADGIQIKISSWLQTGSSLKKYILYRVEGRDQEGSFSISRRYTEFLLLYNSLVTNWPGCFIPPVPRKKATGNFKQKFITFRQHQLQNFLVQLAQKPYLFQESEVQNFIRGQNVTQQSYSCQEIIERYKKYFFQELQGKEISTEINLKIMSFQKYVLKITETLKNLKSIAMNKITSQQIYFKNLHRYFEMMNKYESKITLQEEKERIFSNNYSEQILQLDINQGFSNIHDMLEQEILQIQSIIKVMQQRAKYIEAKEELLEKQKTYKADLQKIMTGKKTFQTLFNKDKQTIIKNYENKINESNQKIDQIILLCEIISGILGYIEIDRFKKEKVQQYYTVMKILSRGQSKNIRTVIDIWKNIQIQSTI